jgi:hypothetical protein
LASVDATNVIDLQAARAERASRNQPAQRSDLDEMAEAVDAISPDRHQFRGLHKLVATIYAFTLAAPEVAQAVLVDFDDEELRAVELFIAAIDSDLASAFVETVLAVQDISGSFSASPATPRSRGQRGEAVRTKDALAETSRYPGSESSPE